MNLLKSCGKAHCYKKTCLWKFNKTFSFTKTFTHYKIFLNWTSDLSNTTKVERFVVLVDLSSVQRFSETLNVRFNAQVKFILILKYSTICLFARANPNIATAGSRPNETPKKFRFAFIKIIPTFEFSPQKLSVAFPPLNVSFLIETFFRG